MELLAVFLGAAAGTIVGYLPMYRRVRRMSTTVPPMAKVNGVWWVYITGEGWVDTTSGKRGFTEWSDGDR